MLSLALAVLAANPTEGAAVVLRGEIEKMTSLPAVQQGDEIIVGSPTRIRLRVTHIVAGEWSDRRKHLKTVIPMASIPQAGRLRDIYLLLERRRGSWHPVIWSYAHLGICIPDDYASAHGLSAKLAELKARAVVNCNTE